MNSTTCNSNEKWNNETCQCECKNYCTCSKDYSWNPSKYICENGNYLKNIADDSKIACDEVIKTMDSVSRNFRNKKIKYEMDCYILHAVLLVIISLTAIICHHFAKHRSDMKKRNIFPSSKIQKWRIMNLKKVRINPNLGEMG